VKINKKYLISVLLILIGLGNVSAHPFYVTICQVYFNKETTSLEISVKIFADDLTKALEKEGHTHLFIGEEREGPNTDTYIFDYMKKKLHFDVNGKPAEYQFVGKELDAAVVWTYLEIKNVENLKSIYTNCTLLTDLFDTQNNIIQVEKDKKVKNLLLNKREISGTITF